MTRDQFIQMLIRLEMDGVLTSDESLELIRRFDNREIDPSTLPSPAPSSSLEEALSLALLLGILGELSRRAILTIPLLRFVPIERDTIGDILRAIGSGEKIVLADMMQDHFAAVTSKYVGLSANDFYTKVREEIKKHMISMAQLGLGTTISPEGILLIESKVREMDAYLLRFAEQKALRDLQGNPWSDKYIANRVRMYSNAGRRFFFEMSELGLEPGWIVDYISMDDDGVCSPCIIAESNSPYLPGYGPMPGEVCLGNCRCQRLPRYEPNMYSRLSNLSLSSQQGA